ncbi:MAG: rhamnosidase, partial [Halioglobus sp.]|nr:rhamnosidase [Halioglobus sp.]
DHTSLHASLFPLAFDLTQEAHHRPLVAWLSSRGMACSVYAAQYFLEALFEHGAATHAIALMTAPGDRSWRHMVASGTTITWEAWDHKYKLNQDWNHAWGAAPANLLPRYILGVSPAAPGWTTANISPREAGLSFARGKVPTPEGAILVDWRREGTFTLALELPRSISARVDVPASEDSQGVYVNGKKASATRSDARWVLDEDVVGKVLIEVR